MSNKYIRYILIIILKLTGKIIGIPMFYLLLPFRHYVRNRVYNYILQNNIYLPRLEEREWTLKNGVYCVKKKSNKEFILRNQAFIQYKKVNKLEYYFALSIWVWFDDDSNYDTYNGKESEETENNPFGNTWDLGDMRGKYPLVNVKKTFKWILRNSFYNFNYLFEEIAENDKNNFYIKFEELKWHFGFIPYSNSTRKGRLVWFGEDYDKLD